MGDALAAWLIVSAIFAEGISIVRNALCIRQKKELPEFDAMAFFYQILLDKMKAKITQTSDEKKP